MAGRSHICASGNGVQSVYRPVSELTHPLAEKAIEFWNARPADGLVIGRDVPSRAIAPLLSRVIVHEPIDGGRDLKVRVAGSGIRRWFGSEITGRKMSALFPGEDFDERRESVMKAIGEGHPQFADCILTTGAIEMLHTELVILPVFAPNHIDIWAMTICCFFN